MSSTANALDEYNSNEQTSHDLTKWDTSNPMTYKYKTYHTFYTDPNEINPWIEVNKKKKKSILKPLSLWVIDLGIRII